MRIYATRNDLNLNAAAIRTAEAGDAVAAVILSGISCDPPKALRFLEAHAREPG